MSIAARFITRSPESLRVYEALLARGNGDRLVTVYRGQIVKVVPIKSETDVCAGIERPNGPVDNARMFEKLLSAPHGEYVVRVCYGRVTSVSPVLREETVKAQNGASSRVRRNKNKAG